MMNKSEFEDFLIYQEEPPKPPAPSPTPDPTVLPQNCSNILYNEGGYVFNSDWQPYLVISGLILLYFSAELYFFLNRRRVSFMTRSPITVAICLIVLCFDSTANTLVFSNLKLGNIFHW